MEVAIQAAANEIINLREKLNEWDGKVGDGDCGSTVSTLPDNIADSHAPKVINLYVGHCSCLLCRCIEVQQLLLKI